MKDFFVTYENLKQSFESEFQIILKKSSLSKAPTVLREALYYSLFTGGKRIRASLVLEISNVYCLDFAKAIYLAGALECLHTYSLVHDDLPAMDDDDFRRGKPSLHKRYDEATAILVGDCLQALSFEFLSCSGCSSLLIYHFSQTVGGAGMVGGQLMDIQEKKQKISIELLNTINFLKTGKLFQASSSLPLRFINAEENLIQSCENWGKELGLLFQIVDDLEEGVDESASNHSMNDRSLNILDVISVKEAWEMAEKLEKKLSQEASHLFSKSIFLRAIPKFVLTRVK